jgi:CheY-like chemotaxis protein
VTALGVVLSCAAGAAATWASVRFVCWAESADRHDVNGSTDQPVITSGPPAVAGVPRSRAASDEPLDEDAAPTNWDPLSVLEGVRVLVVVDEDADSAGLLARMLAPFGARVMTTTSAREALEVIYREPVDVLVCDVRVPHRVCLSLLRQVRAFGGSGDIAAVAIGDWSPTGAGTPRFGFERQIAKPVNALELAHVVAELVKPGRDA